MDTIIPYVRTKSSVMYQLLPDVLIHQSSPQKTELITIYPPLEFGVFVVRFLLL